MGFPARSGEAVRQFWRVNLAASSAPVGFLIDPEGEARSAGVARYSDCWRGSHENLAVIPAKRQQSLVVDTDKNHKIGHKSRLARKVLRHSFVIRFIFCPVGQIFA